MTNTIEHGSFDFTEIQYRDHKEAFIEAWNASFNRTLDSVTSEWLFANASQNRLYVAADRKSRKIAAGYCLLEQQSSYAGNRIASYLCNNVFTVPDFRSHNLFVRLGKFALSQIAGEASFALGIPNAFALPGHLRVGWSRCESLHFFAKEPSHNTISRHITFSPLGEDDLDSLCTLLPRSIFANALRITKTPSYFRWRYFSRPLLDREYFRIGAFKHGTMVGFAMLSFYRPKNVFHILDIDCIEAKLIPVLLDHASNLAKAKGATYINTWASPAFRPYLVNAHFRFTNEESNLIIKCFNPLTTRELLQAARENFFVLGDNDVF